MQGEALRDEWADVGRGGQFGEEGQQVQQLAVGRVLVPGRDRDAVVQLVPKHLWSSGPDTFERAHSIIVTICTPEARYVCMQAAGKGCQNPTP